MGGDFLARILLALEGKEKVVSGLQEVQNAAGKLSSTKVTTVFDSRGIATGKEITETFKPLNAQVSKGSGLMSDFSNAMRRALIVAPVWMIMRGAIQAVTNTIRDQVNFLIELETAMARIKIVGKGTAEEYKYLQQALVSLSYTYGTTASEAAVAAVLFAQQGKTVRETIELTRAAMLASKILGTDIKTAVDDMTAAIEGFQLSVGDATSIVDKWINVEKQFAVTSKDLADATKVAGASANQLGITMNEFLGDVTAVVEVTRKAGSEVARGLSFIYARLLTSGQKTIEQITKIPFYLDKFGNTTNEVGGELRNVSDIIGELAGKWNKLDKEEKLSIATALGSKRQMVVLNALMQNYNASLDARVAALTSAGSAEKAFNIIQDTTATKIKMVGSAWNVLTTALGDTSGFKAGLTIFDELILKLAALFDYEKAYGAVYARAMEKIQLANQSRLNEVKSLQELLEIRKKLAAAPETAENALRLQQVSDAINALAEKELTIKIPLEAGDTEALKKAIDDITEKLKKVDIEISVKKEFEQQIADAENKIREIERTIPDVGTWAKERETKVAAVEKQILQLYKDQAKAIEDQWKIQKGQEAARLPIIEEPEEISISAELTDKEKEKLSIAREIAKVRYEGLDTSEKQIEREIELVKQSKFQYDIHEKNLKLEELTNKLEETRLQNRQKVSTSLINDLITHELDLAKIRGATERTLLDMEVKLGALSKNSYEYKMKMEKLILNEKKKQFEVTDDMTKLYKLGTKYGAYAAEEISKVLLMKQPVEDLRGQVLEAFKEFFPEKYTEMKDSRKILEAFGLFTRNLPGERLPIEERRRQEFLGRVELPEEYALEQTRSMQELIKTFVPTKDVNIQEILINIATQIGKDKKEQVDDLIKNLSDAILTDPNLRKKLSQAIGLGKSG